MVLIIIIIILLLLLLLLLLLPTTTTTTTYYYYYRYHGRVVKFESRSGRHRVKYDDGDSRKHILYHPDEKWELESEEEGAGGVQGPADSRSGLQVMQGEGWEAPESIEPEISGPVSSRVTDGSAQGALTVEGSAAVTLRGSDGNGDDGRSSDGRAMAKSRRLVVGQASGIMSAKQEEDEPTAKATEMVKKGDDEMTKEVIPFPWW